MTEKETILFLDFNNKLTNDTFQKDAFIRIANLEKKNPLVQINDTIFEGTYDYAMGTNLFLEEINESPRPTDPFIKRGPTQLEHVCHTIKTINLKPMKVLPPKEELTQETVKTEFNFDWDYATLLEKFSSGSLKPEDILKTEHQSEDLNNENEIDKNFKDKTNIAEKDSILENFENITTTNIFQKIKDSCEDESILDDMVSTDIIKDYQKLQELAFRPMKLPVVLDKMMDCDSMYKDAHEYHNLEKQVLQPCDFFRNEPICEINEETYANCVDIDRCILYGILEKSFIHPRTLNKEEKQKVFNLNNLDNLSLAGKYYVLKTHVENLENYIKQTDSTELNEKDIYGKTPLKTLEIYKKLTDALKKRLEEIKFSLTQEM